MFRDIIEIAELYVSLRILNVALIGLFILACAIFPQWLIIHGMFVLFAAAALCIPFAIIWALCVVIGAVMRARH